MRAEYRFVPVTRADYPLLAHWLSQPHINGWWGEPDHEIALLEADFDQGTTDMRIVYYNDHPFAYVQDWDVVFEGVWQYSVLLTGSRGLDTFIGDPAYLGQGHAANYLHARAQQMLDAGVSCVVVDPDPANLRAVAAFKKAGFVADGGVPFEGGDLVRLMIFQGGKAPGRTEI